ncbi:hypothetical protein EON65_31440 [archaeon]|nr:MAG: hypothetical protein EON65_31440 [archaeon]
MGAEFNVGLSLLTFNYYLRLTYEPKYFTLTWTLDYQYSSDFGKLNIIHYLMIDILMACMIRVACR